MPQGPQENKTSIAVLLALSAFRTPLALHFMGAIDVGGGGGGGGGLHQHLCISSMVTHPYVQCGTTEM